jgi:hypothetical protein
MRYTLRAMVVVVLPAAMLFSLASALPGGRVEAAPGGKPPPAPQPSVAVALTFLRERIGPVGLLDSYVEDAVDHSYTYDDALAVMAFVSAGDLQSAAVVLNAFLAIGPQPEGGFLDSYHASDGSPVGSLSAGPNGYVLQAINLYRRAVGDDRFDGLASGIAEYLISLQDADGGLFGSSGVTWKSTENNLGALSGIHNLGQSLANPYYRERADAIRDFLITECWTGTRFLTGEGDPTIVTDVQALGPMVLGASFAAAAYWAESYTLTTRRYSGRKTITGFDFNADRDTVWTEGTLQESMAFLVAGDAAKSSAYKLEAEKLFRSSGALLLASNRGTTGYGWTLEPWQAVAPTAWYVFVSRGDNVLLLLP